MICVSLPGPTSDDLWRQIHESQEYADLFEFRCDLYRGVVKDVIARCPLPKIVCHHGCLETMRSLAELEPEYIDLDQSVSMDFQNQFSSKTKIIRSIHDFDETPRDLEGIFTSLTRYPADIYKIASHANSTLDSLRLLCFSRTVNVPLTVVAMGELGHCSRILGASFGAPIVYASPNEGETTAPGQISAKALRSIYSLQKDLKLYGLIGDPVSQSYGHLFHNAYMKSQEAIYVRLRIRKEELSDFFSLATKIGFSGLSVTIPHKEAIFPYLEHIDERSHGIGAVNTITYQNNGYVGTNTDAVASIDALGVPVDGKTIAVIGAGGAARAIVYEATKRGARVVIVNRNHDKAERLGQEYGCVAVKQEELSSYDILINATPNPMPIESQFIHPNIIAMDISTAPDTEILQIVREKGGTSINGREMFERQARMQALEWGLYPNKFKNRFSAAPKPRD